MKEPLISNYTYMTLRVLFLLFCATIIRFSAMAQIEVGGVYFPSITAISTGDNDENPYVDNKLTFAGGIGATFGYNFNENFAFTTGLLYASHNQRFDAYATVGDSTWKIYTGKKRLDYLKVPLLLRYTSSSQGALRYYGFAGPQVAFLLKGDGAIVTYEHYENNGMYFFDLPPASSSYYSPMLIEFSAGLGTEYQLAPDLYLQGALKFDVAFTNTEKKSGFEENYYKNTQHTMDGHNTRNYSLNLMVGVVYRLPGAHSIVHPHGRSRSNGIKYK